MKEQKEKIKVVYTSISLIAPFNDLLSRGSLAFTGGNKSLFVAQLLGYYQAYPKLITNYLSSLNKSKETKKWKQ